MLNPLTVFRFHIATNLQSYHTGCSGILYILLHCTPVGTGQTQNCKHKDCQRKAVFLEIKEKIEKYQHIPVARQTLMMNGEVMVDERDTEFYNVLHESCIQLRIEQDPEKPSAKSSLPLQQTAEPVAPGKLQVQVKIPGYKKQFSIEVEVNDTIARLKERIVEVETMPLNRFSVSFNGNELGENQVVGDYGISNYSEVMVVLRSCPPSSSPPVMAGGGSSCSSGGGGGSNLMNLKKLKLMVLPKTGGQKIQVEVNPGENVGDLKKELQRLQQQVNFQLPPEGYFFIYKQNVMDDDRSFRWHDVKQGDTIEIFSGSVTGGG